MGNLQVRVAEASGVHLDQKLMISNLGDSSGAQLIWLVVLGSKLDHVEWL